jgi:hypothetical protein
VITSSCHCGAVTLETEVSPEVVTECNCSICRRLGARWAHYAREQVRVTSAPGDLGVYLWGDREIEFYHCTRCGCTTHYEFVDKQPGSRLSINTRGMDPDVVANARVRLFDGASM